MKPAPKNNRLTPLLRWLSGDATRRDEQALDALAQNDPFLAEAMEGYRSMPEANHTAAVTKLKAELRRKYEKKRRDAVFYLARIAAVGLVVLTAWFVFRQTNDTTQSNAEVAVVQTEESATPPAPAANDMASADTSPVTEATTQQELTDRTVSLKKETFARRAKPGSPEEIANTLTAANEPVISEERSIISPASTEAKDSAVALMEAGDAIVAQPAAKEAASATPPPATRERSAVPLSKLDAAKTSGPPRLVSGKVMDERGDPLIGVNVFAPGTSKGVVTDMNGSFSIDASGASKLAFNYVGYETIEVPLGNNAYLDVTLTESAAQLSEVVVSGYKAPNKAKKQSAATPKPEGGFRKLEKHIEKHLKHPEPDAQKRLSGEVTLRFRVNPDGSLSDMQIEKSLSASYDEEAKRLLREGPKWKPAGSATYTIKFKF